ncbi:hypothetical protein BFJ70_g16116 [Fusarium oxysporum]|uniref:Uncharacterized protein n=2 Tax=Fusarium oxysporum TaxID=5507 RepID=A0A2H3G8N9_FUSOX|nr:hypothetical protein AU210_012532 [Fusarium oxysporum f. sp. radicis-cucumerinum]RKK10048.1 hypothetical protein BFJ65_g15351 [Fusarium oxysporum f. sp. cepae]RKK30711.1 hypothetical protein BFJ67_g15608 [Fusarium oxysporum f. sp. cepae]RKK35962.1 hypothetical protein BFJ66_g13706 [Fusarium oxysporum f. sp. cepae]RKL12712.1 hypothetical protein BFJ70_g16116 [Fusarium oxysporum]
MVEARDKETGTALSTEDLVENAGVFIEAESGTTASSLVYLIYELARRPEMQKRIVEEIRQAFPDPSIFPTYEKANKLPYLSQIIREVLRLRGPLSTFIPRVSPGKSIAGVYVPAGVIVGCQAYTTARDENVFPDPLEFNPDRWENPTEQMQAMDRPFSSGPRVCIGMHVSRVEMLLTACAFYQTFDVELAAGFRHEGMELDDQGFMMAKGESLLVNLTPIN